MGTGLYYCVHREGIRENGLQLRQGRFRLDVRKKKITVTVVKHWNRVPGELVGVTIPGGVEELSGSGAEQWLMV